MIVDRYYYHQLNKQEQVIYKAFYKGVMAHQEIIPIPIKGIISQAAFERIFAAVTRDNPLIYFLNQSACNYAQDMFGHTAICPQYFFSKDKIKEYNRKIEKVVNGLVGQLQLTEGTDYEKELKVHDWLCRNVEYDFKGADMSNPVRVISAHNIIGVFAHRRAQCEGIAKAAKVLLNAVDVKCILATGDADGNGQSGPHAWNVVNVDGKPYHLDVTWDIGALDSEKKRMAYDYFNITDTQILKTHKIESKLPVCNALDDNYFKRNKIFFRTKEQLLSYISSAASKGQSDYYFQLSENLDLQAAVKEVLNVIAKTRLKYGKQGLRFRHILNNEMNICWIGIY